MDYGWPIELRPDDLASPRATRRTDDLLSNLDYFEPAVHLHGLTDHVLKKSIP